MPIAADSHDTFRYLGRGFGSADMGMPEFQRNKTSFGAFRLYGYFGCLGVEVEDKVEIAWCEQAAPRSNLQLARRATEANWSRER
jgi:hypothetical protein